LKPAEDSPVLPPRRRSPASPVSSVLSSPRLCTYVVCTALALWVSCLLGKDMSWDTLDYHFYAGFSALHDRFGLDYFPAGSQTYFNPYVYVPFFLLASSRMPAILDASILAVVQSGILWLTYEIALQLAPREDRRAPVMMTVCAVLLAFANPILLDQFGSSFADITTAELVLAGWLLLLLTIRTPSVKCVVLAGLLLGAASALKLTNGVHALSASILLLFVPARWSGRFRHASIFGAALVLSFVVICLPWSLHLERHFGNPLFPVLNEIFRSPQFPTTKMLDYRFIPDSVAEALWRPFEIVKPVYMVDDELPAPDLRYAVLLTALILLALRWAWRRREGVRPPDEPLCVPDGGGRRALFALGSAFLVDWVLWLAASGNGRYFLPAACIAAVLAVALIFRLCAAPRARAYALAAVLGAQLLQLYWGAGYRNHIPWDGGPWFEVSVPGALPRTPALYLSYGVQSNSFLVPFLPRGSGFVNIAGDYPLGPDGANGAQIQALMHRYSPHLMVLAREEHAQDKRLPVISGIPAAADALQPFSLRPLPNSCFTFVIPDEGRQGVMFAHTERVGSPQSTQPHDVQVLESATGYLVACGVAPYPSPLTALAASKHKAEMALDQLEDACPDLFQPRRPLTQFFGDVDHHQIWSRRYLNTNLTAWVSRGWVAFIDPLRGGGAKYVAPIAKFADPHLRIECGRHDERYFVNLMGSAPRQAAQ
jgi:hypothetical protein